MSTEQITAFVEHGAETGCVEISELNELAETLHLGDEEVATLYEQLEEHHVEVNDDCGREKVESTYINGDLAHATTDALQLFLNEMGRYPQQTGEEDVDRAKRIERGDNAAKDRIINSNLGGVFLMTRAVGRHLVEQRSGKVINIASNFGLMGVANHAAYSASKAGIIGLTRSLAVEWARHNVQVNALAPGYFATDLNAAMRADQALTDRVLRAIPARRMGEVSEIAPWVLLLAGSESDFMTGETIVLDGGHSAR